MISPITKLPSGSVSHSRKAAAVVEQYPAVMDRLTGGEYRAVGRGVTFRCPFQARHKHGDRNWSCRAWIGSRGELVCRCLGCQAGWSEFIRESGLTSQAFWPAHTHWGRISMATMPQPKAVATYLYRHEDGTEYGTKTRWEPGYHGRPKSFTWSRPVPADLRLLCNIPESDPAVIDGKESMGEGWFLPAKWADGWHLRATEAESPQAVFVGAAPPPPLYRLPELLAAPPERGVCIVEGEKACEALRALGFVAVCPPNGANTWLAEWSRYFEGRSVLLLPDNDHPGRGLMEVVAGLLMFSGAAREIRVLAGGVEGYQLGDGCDVADWLAVRRHERPATLRTALWALASSQPVYRREVPRAAA